MAESVRVIAPAKVNLHLRVYSRRADGYHDIFSLFQAISLRDALVIRSLKESDTIEIVGNFDCPAESTTVYKAAAAYLRKTGIRKGVHIDVEKRIPAGAGMGGGSSDAASTLRAMDLLFHGTLPEADLSAIGASIGSDVPFFLTSAAAIVTGRGERVKPVEARADFGLVLVNPGFPLQTAAAYALLDAARSADSEESDIPEDLIYSRYRSDCASWPFWNSFEAVQTKVHPVLAAIKSRLYSAGASFSAMSGSGSTMFGVFPDGADAQRVAAKLRFDGLDAVAASPLARVQYLD